MKIVHLTASTFFGGPERQMLGLAQALRGQHDSAFLSFAEGGKCQAFLGKAQTAGFPAEPLRNDTPHFRTTLNELTDRLRQWQADVLLSHTFKPNILGRLACRRLGIPSVVVSRGWTWENLRVRVYELLDRVNLRWVDHVVAVSAGQYGRVRNAGVPQTRVSLIRNSARVEALQTPYFEAHARVLGSFQEPQPEFVVVAAGRLSPEKGFDVLAQAARLVVAQNPRIGFLVFGEGNERGKIEAILAEHRLHQNFVLAGFSENLDAVLPGADLVVLPSHTEGLPNVALEALSAGVPVVATAVGGTPEIVRPGQTGRLVPPGDPEALAREILDLAQNSPERQRLGSGGRQLMWDEFTFAAQARRYDELLTTLVRRSRRGGA
jgi:glycosyltransferase involved in cell wall biosynthesis